MPITEDQLRNFAKELFQINAIKFGEFKTKVGLMTPVYCDLRVIVSYPKLLDSLSDLLIAFYEDLKNFDVICGVPYTALPIATVVSTKSSIPMVMRRKEAKSYGTKNLIEGVFQEGNECLIVEDVVTSGSSILETVKDLNSVGIKCTDAIVILNREQGGCDFLRKNGIKMHALFTLTQLMEYLKQEGLIGDDMVKKVKQYLSTTQVDLPTTVSSQTDRLKLSFEQRLECASNLVTSKLLNIMISKKTNLCVASDITDSTDLLNLAEKVGPHICLLKTHIDILDDFHPNLIRHLKELSERHNFLLFEDRKFSDIGKTVELQYSKGIYKISSWANLVTVHSLMGKAVLDAINNSEGINQRGVFLLAEASSSGNLINEEYVNKTLKMVNDYPDLITGLVCQNPLFRTSPGLLQLTPGVQITAKEDNLGQQYNTPEHVISEKGADIAVVGRGITKATDPEMMAQTYKKLLWNAYLDRIKK